MPEKPSIHAVINEIVSPAGDDRFADPKEARKKAMDYLARREYGQRELNNKLVTAGFDTEAADAALEGLTAEGLQDDRRFAESFVQTRINQGKGPVRIRADLGQRGIPGDIIDAALDGLDENWYELAKVIRLKKFGPERPSDFKDKARQMRFLQYRGFEADHIRAAVAVDDDWA